MASVIGWELLVQSSQAEYTYTLHPPWRIFVSKEHAWSGWLVGFANYVAPACLSKIDIVAATCPKIHGFFLPSLMTHHHDLNDLNESPSQNEHTDGLAAVGETQRHHLLNSF
eukprot:scaffold2058_cov115-Cylindrotheca_fusiformis.AAC.8